MSETLDETRDRAKKEEDTFLALFIAWCADPSRVGDMFVVEKATTLIGRGGAQPDDPHRRATIVQQRPGKTEPRPDLEIPKLSRAQLEIREDGDAIAITCIGKRALLDAAGEEHEKVRLLPGQACEVSGQLVLFACRRPRKMRAAKYGAFGEPDRHGFVGETPVAWTLREQCAFVGGRTGHVLVLGESGVGKEVVAKCVHAESKRANKALISRNAATIPSTLADAELFGNLANYPNPGTPERKGLIGEADGGSLFLDEIGELPEEMQAKLLRVLDSRGEYHRLGEGRPRQSDFRLIAATNRPLASLKHDLAARFRLRLTVPGLDERREDIPLLARHVLQQAVREDPEIGERFFDNGEPRLSSALMRVLVMHDYRTHVRELDGLLWRSLSTSTENVAELTDEVREELTLSHGSRAPTEVSAEEVRAALERAGGVQERAWRELGLANRYVLKRLIKKFGI